MNEADEGRLEPSRLWRIPALLVSLAFVAATLWPALREPPQDSFPLSNYPMFSWVRKSAWLHVVVGFDAAGEERPIPPRIVANVEVMQAAETIRLAIRKRRAKQLCAWVSGRLAELDEDDELAQIVRVEVQSRLFDPHTYFVEATGKTPPKLRRRAACAVPSREAQP